MAKRALSREQFERDRAQFRVGTQGPASEVRKIDVASVDTAALIERLEGEKKRWDERSLRYAGK
jgi:hypothetical protein